MAQLDKSLTIIKAPLISEKTTLLAANRQYVFWVDNNANKVEIRKAVEKIYNVKVENVSTIILKGAITRVRANQPGKKPDQKKAIITLKKGFEIKLT